MTPSSVITPRRPLRSPLQLRLLGALLPAVPEDAAGLDTVELRGGQVRWATIDSPWVHGVDRDAFGPALDRLRSIEPAMVCSSHLPPVARRHARPVRRVTGHGARCRPLVGPDHAALEAMLAGMVDVAA